jgi:O-acetyl-ADP-ribose deacetylase
MLAKILFPDMHISLVSGDLLEQKVEVIVNAWNRNVIPWWLLLPQGVSGAIKKRGGYGPFRELGKLGPIPLGEARWTSAGRLPFKGIIHVAGINLAWRSSAKAVARCVESALSLATEHGVASIAFPLIGAGTGGLKHETAKAIILEEAARADFSGEIIVVQHRKEGRAG